jgi:hypothetical protein
MPVKTERGLGKFPAACYALVPDETLSLIHI